MPLSIQVHDRVSISESISIETEIDSGIYRDEFEKHRREYSATNSEHHLIFAFIFLHMYMECFLHQRMRQTIEREFTHKDKNIVTNWHEKEEREKMYVNTKLICFTSVFFQPIPENTKKKLNIIIKRYSKLSDIRNRFVHGYKVAAYSDSNGHASKTPTRSLLTQRQLIQVIKHANALGKVWNEILDDVLSRCRSARQVDDFKFTNL
jgi:hypothetical protein